MDEDNNRLEDFDQPDIESPPVPEMPDVTNTGVDSPDRNIPVITDLPDAQSPDDDFGSDKKDEGW